MEQIRTDLALEAHQMCTTENVGEYSGIKVNEKDEGSIKITKIDVLDDEGSKVLGKPVGRYITVESPDIKYDLESYEKTCIILSNLIKEMMGTQKKTLVVGLGNKQITPDALGPLVAEKLMVTGHIKEEGTDILGDDFSSVYAIAPGVLGTTGIESAEVIKGVVERVKPDVIIAVDALASRSINRISTTFQISDTGINPGSGVANKRKALSEETLGVKVIAIGVPTVVDAKTVAIDSIDTALGEIGEKDLDEMKKGEFIKEHIGSEIGSLMVTPKDIDIVIEKTSKTVANGINLALHKNLTFRDIEGYVG